MNIEIKSIVVDTLNTIQDNQYTEDAKSVIQQSTWKDYGIDLNGFINFLVKSGFELVFIIGESGTGKSFGMKTLKPKEFIWFNTDHKNSSWQITKEFYEAYGTRTDPKDFMRLPTTYKEITSTITALAKGVDTKEDKIKLSNSPVAFLLGHPEEYRVNEQVKRRLRTLGKLSSKLGLEGKSLYTFYTQVVTNFKGVSEFLLTTQNSGFDTARTPEGLFLPSIKNDFQFILNSIQTRNQNPFS